MHTPRGARALLLAGVTVLASALGVSPTQAAAPSAATPIDITAAGAITATTIPGGGDTDKVSPRLRVGGGRQTVFVEFAGTGAAEAARAGGSGTALDRRAQVANTSASVLSAARAADPQASQLFSVSNAVPGMALNTDLAAITALGQRADVVRISPLSPKRLQNAGADQLTRALDTWASTGRTGEGVRVGIIDTGIDYTHADFGGPGTATAWEQAHADSAGAWSPTVKVAGGYDFVGDDYNADPDAADYQPVAHPDPNPLDCEGHGTHVAGTVAGYGVNADGSTFTGDYAALNGDDLMAMTIAPGTAPMATLYGLKVFGCDGSTDYVIPALDWALDPNGDGDFSDHLDVINLSLGSDYGAEDDPENAVIDRLSAAGVLAVVSAGNADDITDIGGSPGNAVTALTVASSVDPYQLRDGLRVDAPADVAGIAPGQVSAAFDWANEADVSGQVVTLSADNADGCAPLSEADAAVVAGKVAWLVWDDNDATRRCGSGGRSANIVAAGGIGAVLTSSLEVFGAGILGSAVIPVFQLPASQTERLRPAAEAGTLQVTFSGSLVGTIQQVDPSIADTVSSFTSRGNHGSVTVVKPDVAAPGDTIASAAVGGGTAGSVKSGTSMAAPHTSGIAALVKQAHPSWSTEQIKAAVMNTAAHDIYTGPNNTGQVYGPNRIGAGRVDALAAVQGSVLAYAADRPGAVSISFGPVDAPINRSRVVRNQQLTLENTGTSTANLSLSYAATTSQPGVSYQVWPKSVRVAPGAKASVTVRMVITPSALRRTLDPTMSATNVNPFFGEPEARQFIADAAGRLLISTGSGAALRVPVYGAAKPVSTTTTSLGSVSGSRALVLAGTGVGQGSGASGYTSLVSAMTLGYASPREPYCNGRIRPGCATGPTMRSGDLQYVGAGSAGGALYFGIASYSNWASAGNPKLIPYVDIDTTGSPAPEYQVYVKMLPNTDLYYAWLVDLATGDLIDIQPVNFLDGATDTNVFDTNVMLIPVNPAAIGMAEGAKAFPISYRVATSSYLASPDAAGDIDATPYVKFDVARPAIGTASPLYVDAGGTAIPITARGKVSALVLHLHGDTGARAEVVQVRP